MRFAQKALGTRGLYNLVPLRANGHSAFPMYKRDEGGGVFRPSSLHVVEWVGDKVSEITAFLEPRLFESLGLAPALT